MGRSSLGSSLRERVGAVFDGEPSGAPLLGRRRRGRPRGGSRRIRSWRRACRSYRPAARPGCGQERHSPLFDGGDPATDFSAGYVARRTFLTVPQFGLLLNGTGRAGKLAAEDRKKAAAALKREAEQFPLVSPQRFTADVGTWCRLQGMPADRIAAGCSRTWQGRDAASTCLGR